MKTDKEIQKYIAEQKIVQAHRTAMKTERLLKVVAVENQMTFLCDHFLKFLDINKDKLIGKKLYNNDGISKYFKEFFESWKENILEKPIFSAYIQQSNLKLRANFSGGSYDDNSYYCDYIDRTFYDVINCDAKGICLSIRTEPNNYPMYSYEQMEAAKVAIKDYNKQIEILKDNIRTAEKSIPYYLHNQRHEY